MIGPLGESAMMVPSNGDIGHCDLLYVDLD